MFECKHCGKEIEKYEEFYRINGEFYCGDCIEEHIRVFYTLKGDTEPIEDEDVMTYDDIENYKERLTYRLRICKNELLRFEKEKETHSTKWYIREYKKDIKELEERLNELKKEYGELE